MNITSHINKGALTSLAFLLASTFVRAATGEYGKMSADEFKKANDDAGMIVKGLKPDTDPLSAEDKGLLREIAMGGMLQIELSRAVTLLNPSEDIKTIANAELAEQSLIAAKLGEMASAGGASMPDALDTEARAVVDNLKRQTGSDIDKTYLQVSGVQGHEKLKATMEKVQKDAKSPALKALAEAALPLINTHLQVARDEASELNEED